MTMSITSMLGLVYALSELGLGFTKRAKLGETRVDDRGSLRLLWVVIVLSLMTAFILAPKLPEAGMGFGSARAVTGAILFALGLTIRWYSIIHLGRFFTVDVAIATDHRLIDTGPYRYIRHPSYSGALMAFLGLALCLGNWVSLAVIVIPIFWVFVRRMRVEEEALLGAFPTQYRDYMARTKRLIPAIY
jgi:protein-S-isoprenylcysteine O-methyltransferase